MKKLNVGCGYRYNSDWTNLDFKSNGPNVIAWDLRKGIPYPDNNFDIIYNSHLLEHLTKIAAEQFMKECFRVLRPGGVLRIVVPDLESITRTYLQALELCLEGSKSWSYHYQWLMLEIYDQAVRNNPGGEMKAYLAENKVFNEDFVISRCGIEAKEIIDASLDRKKNPETNHSEKGTLQNFVSRFCKPLKYYYFLHEILKKIVLGKEYQILKIGRFRESGEVHLWMYDRYSLSDLFERIGFERIIQRSATQSYLLHWTKYCLDTDPNGAVYKPGSLFMEGIKPSP